MVLHMMEFRVKTVNVTKVNEKKVGGRLLGSTQGVWCDLGTFLVSCPDADSETGL